MARTILTIRRNILNLQNKLDNLEYPTRIHKKDMPDIPGQSKQILTKTIYYINKICEKIYMDKQRLQKRIQYYLDLLKANPYIITPRDKIVSKALDLKKNKEKKITNEEKVINDINKLENDYTKLVNDIANHKFKKLQVLEPIKKNINNSRSPYRRIQSKTIDIRKDIKIIDVDSTKRSVNEWAKIYHIKIYNNINYEVMNEYEFCWNLENTLQYILYSDNKANQQELRARLIYLDIINNATEEEKEQLKNKFVITDFIRQQLNDINC